MVFADPQAAIGSMSWMLPFILGLNPNLFPRRLTNTVRPPFPLGQRNSSKTPDWAQVSYTKHNHEAAATGAGCRVKLEETNNSAPFACCFKNGQAISASPVANSTVLASAEERFISTH